MPEALVSEGLWEVIGPLLPAESPKPKGERPRVPDRAALEGIVYVLRSGIPWRMLPGEFGCSGVTCWRRLRDWQEAGVWRRLRQALLDRLGQAGLIDWSRASVDSASTPAKKGGEDRSQPGGPRQTRLETPPARRRARRSSRCSPGPGPRPKDLRGVGRRRRASKGTKGTAQDAAREAARRQRLRLPALPEVSAPPGHQGSHSKTGSRK
jgi:transposase